MVSIEGPRRSVALYNTPLETGIRAVVVLNASYPMSFDLGQLTWFDHLIVHTADIGGPSSLHPDLPSRSGELLVRRRIVERGVDLMRRLYLVDRTAGTNGIYYRATEEAYPFVELMKTRYAEQLKERAVWLAANVCALPGDELNRLIVEKIGRWRVEFNALEIPMGSEFE